MNAMKGSSSADVVREFFAAFGRGDVEGVIGTFHPEARIVAVRQAARRENELYGNYAGSEGARAMLMTLGKLFETQAFSVDQVLGEGAVAFASGSFVHKVKSTGKPFSSDWALRCVIKDGKILQYRFFEDSAAYVEASR
ncbi:nuclear transport factor 2 family protein [Myxococcaceae bacterium GXIMD 01537]